ncbi:MAG: hypothetical protein NT099_08840 [Candidatus Saganbacteria bacterium]|nr:hypothetical protein [Candidatus Saganbacteria bacterium]
MKDFSVDIVYCYADNNPERQKQRESLIAETTFKDPVEKEAIAPQRFNDYGEFRYSVRSVAKFAPWFRNLHIITATPNIAWLRHEGDGHKVFIIPDERLFPSKKYLPNFNSGSLETRFDKIPGLSEHFIYFNDDVFLGNHVTKYDFFTPDGRCSINEMRELTPQQFLSIRFGLHKKHIINGLNAFQKKYSPEKGRWGAHQAQPILKSVYRACKKAFAAECETTARNRFRSIDDILITVVLYPSYALYHKRAVLPERDKKLSHIYISIIDDLGKNEVSWNKNPPSNIRLIPLSKI